MQDTHSASRRLDVLEREAPHLIAGEREFVAVFVSGDGGRTMTRELAAVDVDGAVGQAIALVDGGEFGARASWFVGGVVQLEHVSVVAAALEALT